MGVRLDPWAPSLSEIPREGGPHVTMRPRNPRLVSTQGMKPREGEHAQNWSTLGVEKKNGWPQTGRRSHMNYIPGGPKARKSTNYIQNLGDVVLNESNP